MNKKMKVIMLLIGTIAFLGGGAFFLISHLEGYAILCFTVAVILLLYGIVTIINNRNPNKVYESRIKDILNTFDSILVQINTAPKLEGRSIIIVETMDDMIDAQLEIRKPICYLKQTESCSFILLDDKEVYIYIEKLNESITSPIEIELNEIKLKQKNADEMDSEMLRDIDKTTIIKLSNKKSYKVSPVRKKQPIKEEIEIL